MIVRLLGDAPQINQGRQGSVLNVLDAANVPVKVSYQPFYVNVVRNRFEPVRCHGEGSSLTLERAELVVILSSQGNNHADPTTTIERTDPLAGALKGRKLKANQLLELVQN